MTYPLVRELAAEGMAVTVICEVLGLCRQAYSRWLDRPVSTRDWDDAHLIDRMLAIHADVPGLRLSFGRTGDAFDTQSSSGVADVERRPGPSYDWRGQRWSDPALDWQGPDGLTRHTTGDTTTDPCQDECGAAV